MVRNMRNPKGQASQAPIGQADGLFVTADVLKKLVQIAVQHALEAQVEHHLGAEPYERTGAGQGRRNGTKPRTMKMRLGELEFAVPQVRDGLYRSGARQPFPNTTESAPSPPTPTSSTAAWTARENAARRIEEGKPYKNRRP